MKIALIGTGKMGSAIAELAIKSGHEIIFKINENALNLLHPEHLSKADIAIEFSSPEAVVHNLRSCLKAGVPVVCGTTGWLEHYDTLAAEFIAEKGSFLYASNFSIGVNLLFELNRILAGWMNKLPSYKPFITEIHHIHKMDSPSGTAISLANDIINVNANYKNWGLVDNNNPENETLVPIEALRAEEVVGRHAISWRSPIDKITLHHEAYSREGYASGALQAAEWIQGKKGVFTMKDLLFPS